MSALRSVVRLLTTLSPTHYLLSLISAPVAELTLFETVELSYRSGLLNRSCSFLYNISFPIPQVWSLAVQGSEISTGAGLPCIGS
jgi:hypothetical protein